MAHTVDLDISLASSDFTKIHLSNGSDLFAGKKDDGMGFSLITPITLGSYHTKGDSITNHHTLVVGGQGVKGTTGQGLEYSEYGMWANKIDILNDGDYANGDDPNYYSDVTSMEAFPFTGGSASKTASAATLGLSPSSPLVMTGAATAVAATKNPDLYYLGPDDKSAIIYGTATLTLNTSGGALGGSSQNKLELDFVNFYKLTFTALNGGGASGALSSISNTGVLDIQDNNNTTGISMAAGSGSNMYNITVAGQLYGAVANQPSEAVGRFQIIGKNGRTEAILGAFGVRK
jgi:hypothetical protein